jgi:hypothetical protein
MDCLEDTLLQLALCCLTSATVWKQGGGGNIRIQRQPVLDFADAITSRRRGDSDGRKPEKEEEILQTRVVVELVGEETGCPGEALLEGDGENASWLGEINQLREEFVGPFIR